MNQEQEANFIAKYALIQEAINNASNLIIQVLGFSIAAIIALIVATIQTQAIYILFFVLLIIYFSILYISVQAKSITETEAYLVTFVEPEIPNFGWRKMIFEKYQRNPNKKYMLRPPLNFPDFAAFTYICILFSIILLSASNEFSKKSTNLDITNITLIISAFAFIFLVIQATEYSKEDYYLKCKQDFEKQKERLQSLKPSQAKLVDKNGVEIAIPEPTYQVLSQVTEIMASGQTVSVTPEKGEVSIQEAANILNVSHSFLQKLLEEGTIPFTKVNSEQSIRFEDLITYKKQRDIERRKGMREFTQFLQDEGFYEDEGVKFDS